MKQTNYSSPSQYVSQEQQTSITYGGGMFGGDGDGVSELTLGNLVNQNWVDGNWIETPAYYGVDQDLSANDGDSSISTQLIKFWND